MSFVANPTTTIAVGPRSSAMAIAIPATVVVFVVLYRISKHVASRYERQIRQAIAEAEAAAGRGRAGK
jgi:hypothetical protein